MKLTRQQRVALKRVYDRAPLKLVELPRGPMPMRADDWDRKRCSYREFRKLVQPEFSVNPAIMVPWCGMWLGIEPDGYTHS